MKELVGQSFTSNSHGLPLSHINKHLLTSICRISATAWTSGEIPVLVKMWKFGSSEDNQESDQSDQQERGFFGDVIGKVKSSTQQFTVGAMIHLGNIRLPSLTWIVVQLF